MTIINVNDELFGRLEYINNFWRGKTTIKMFDLEKEIILSVDADESANFSNVQKDAFSKFNQNMKKIIEDAEIQIYDYYNENYQEYREMLENDPEIDKIAPEIDSISDLRKLVKPTELIVRRVRSKGRRLGLLCDASWNIEDGLGIRIEDEIVEEVGYQDSIL
jgi:flagellar motility protein MotE (MotC chaperone)